MGSKQKWMKNDFMCGEIDEIMRSCVKKVILCEECWLKLLIYRSKISAATYLQFLTALIKYLNGKTISASYV